MKLLTIFFVSLLLFPAFVNAGGVDDFFLKHPELKSKYRYLLQTSIDLEVDRENKKQADLFSLLDDVQHKLSKSADAKSAISRQADMLRSNYDSIIKAWDKLREEVGPMDILCVYRIVDGAKSESGYLILRHGEIVRLLKETEGVNLL
jgi:hypothetical protein